MFFCAIFFTLVATRQHIASVRIYRTEGISQIPSGIYIDEKKTDFNKKSVFFSGRGRALPLISTINLNPLRLYVSRKNIKMKNISFLTVFHVFSYLSFLHYISLKLKGQEEGFLFLFYYVF